MIVSFIIVFRAQKMDQVFAIAVKVEKAAGLIIATTFVLVGLY